MKSYTDLEQSRKLTEILSLESADMYYPHLGGSQYGETPRVGNMSEMYSSKPDIPCWSFASLLNIIPTMVGSVFEKDALRLRIDKSETNFNIWYDNLDTGMVEEGFDIIETNPVDACYEMIMRLHELKML